MTILPNSVDGTTLRQQLNNSRDMVPMTWLGVFPDPTAATGTGVVKVIHRLAVYGVPMGVAANPNVHDHLYGLVDDLLAGNQVPHFKVPQAAMDITADLWVPTVETLNANLNPLPTSFGPYANNGADSETVPMRSLCWVPPFVASWVMASSDRSPRVVAQIIGSTINTIGWTKLESNLLVWVRAMLTANAQGNSLVQIPDLAQAPLDVGLVNFCWALVSQDLPTLGNAAVHSGA
mmetsp:Transcript_20827/g.31380  ORF Transcript_20827/g.31380 Transcript_20827/m.31380 type:complete len:234 (+) Transcript_20827:295-996(+)